MSQWLNNAVARAEQFDDWLAPQRQQSLKLLREQSWPTRKTEAWKYTSVNMLADQLFDVPNQQASGAAPKSIDNLNSIDLLFVDGQLQTDIASLPRLAGLSISSLAEADNNGQGWGGELFSSIKPDRHLFGLVNDVLAGNGLLIDVDANAHIETPIRIVQHTSEGVESHARVLVRLGTEAKATVIEQLEGSVSSFSTSFAEYQIADRAELEHYRFALQVVSALNVGGSHFQLGERSELNSTIVGFGSELSRLDLDVIYQGEHANTKMNAMYLLDGKEMFDLHSCIEHAVPHCTTEENVRIIAADHSRAIFNGRIHIHRDAQNTLGELNNRNLLMSANAEINTKPELEIYADDVRCAHGATVAEIDDEALYYMQARGISREQAQIMLSFGFINELVDQMPSEALADWLRPQLRQRFANMEVRI